MPDLARSVALQEDKLIGYQDGLNHCLFRNHRVLAPLSDAEVWERDGEREIGREKERQREWIDKPLHKTNGENFLGVAL